MCNRCLNIPTRCASLWIHEVGIIALDLFKPSPRNNDRFHLELITLRNNQIISSTKWSRKEMIMLRDQINKVLEE